MSINLGGGKAVLSMALIDLGSGKETTLFEREGSYCQFHDDIYFENYIITLRVDWNDIKNTDPVLDADIYHNANGKKGKKVRNGPWHHTPKKFDDEAGHKIYNFAYKELELRLSARMSFGLSVSMGAILVREGDKG